MAELLLALDRLRMDVTAAAAARAQTASTPLVDFLYADGKVPDQDAQPGVAAADPRGA